MTEQMWDAPNQQVVRRDASGPWEEGDGGSTGDPPVEADTDPLDAMTKDELIEEASARGIDVTASMTKDEIKAAIRAG